MRGSHEYIQNMGKNIISVWRGLLAIVRKKVGRHRLIAVSTPINVGFIKAHKGYNKFHPTEDRPIDTVDQVYCCLVHRRLRRLQ